MELNREQDMEKRIVSQREEIRRLQNCIHNLKQSRDSHREKAERLGKQLRDALNDKKELTEENKRLESLCTAKDIIIGDLSKENARLRK